jgi:hypothetical protein
MRVKPGSGCQSIFDMNSREGMLDCSSTADQIEDEHNDRDHDEQVNEGAADMEREAEEPQNQQDDKDCPKHEISFALAPGIEYAITGAEAHFYWC